MSEERRAVIVRYGEIGLKRGNRRDFEKLLKSNIVSALRATEHGNIERPHGRIIIREPADPSSTAERVARVFGVKSTSAAISVPAQKDRIEEAAMLVLEEALQRRANREGDGLTMKVETKRVDKSFPHGSMEFSMAVADTLLTRYSELGVRMKRPDLTVGIEIRPEQALVYAERIPGPGGLPIGSLGDAVVLFSGGIDSPVAAWLAMKRGLRTALLHFHAPPFVGDASREKAVDLARVLSRYAGKLRLFVVSFGEIQVAIRQGALEPYRTLLYRRAMNRVASRLADQFHARAYVTGEALGQVASQTLENLACIEESADRIVLRPLITHDKEETILLAKQIGTYDISRRPHPDCCTLFTPERPKIRGDLGEILEIEKQLDLDDLVNRCYEGREAIVLVEGEVVEPASQDGVRGAQPTRSENT